MSSRIEVESKFFCKEKEKLYDIISKLGMIKTEKNQEVDEYFTDVNCNYIKNRTCLRIRTTIWN